MTSSPACDVICDWLDTTYAPNDCPYPDVNRLLLSAGFVAKPPPEAGVHVYHPPQVSLIYTSDAADERLGVDLGR